MFAQNKVKNNLLCAHTHSCYTQKPCTPLGLRFSLKGFSKNLDDPTAF